MFSTVPLRPTPIKYTSMHPFLSAVYFHFRHNQLSLYINLVCFDSISTKDNSVIRHFLTGFFVRALGVAVLRKKRMSDHRVNETFNRQGFKADANESTAELTLL